MQALITSLAGAAGRVMLAGIFLMSALANKIPNFGKVAEYMASEGVPLPRVMLAGAIGFLVVGGVSLVVGYRARSGAGLLLVFLILATYFFHDFWTYEGQERQQQSIQFLKNVSLMGALLMVIANGPGRLSVDALAGRSADRETSAA